MNISIRELKIEDKYLFLEAAQASLILHQPWVKAPLNEQEFDEYLTRSQQPNQKCFLLFGAIHQIIGVFNISEIVRGVFQNAFLGFYVFSHYAEKGYMSKGLKLVLEKIFNELKLHRIEANIQPANIRSIQLVKNNGFRYEGFSPRYLKIYNVWCGHEHWAMTSEDFIKEDPETLKNDYVEITPYNPDWPKMATLEIQRILEKLPKDTVIDIQHIGSTAIFGMAAKPIIDIQIAVNSLEEIKLLAILELQKLGYEYWEKNPDTTRMFFVKGMPPYGEKRTHHVHIVEKDSSHWRNKIAFRDYLKSHSNIAKEYEALKITLAKKHKSDREKYTDEKEKFINSILALTRKK